MMNGVEKGEDFLEVDEGNKDRQLWVLKGI